MLAKPHQVSDFLNQRRSLQHLLKEIRHHQQLLVLIRRKLPKKIAAHCHSVIMHGSELCISVDSPVWGSQLRFEAPNLLSQLRQDVPHIGSIKVRTAPIRTHKTHSMERTIQRNCSENTIQHLNSCANYISQADLKQAMRRLAKTMQSKRVSTIC